MGDNVIVNDKRLAYSFIMVNEGYPSIFWYDYYNNGLARPGTPNGIDALIDAHHKYAGGEACRSCMPIPDLYIHAARLDTRTKAPISRGCVYVLNNLGRQVVGHLGEDEVAESEVRSGRLGWA